MNEQNFSFYIEPTPTLPSRSCRFKAKFLSYCLNYSYIIIPLVVIFINPQHWFFGLLLLVFGFIITGIIRSTIRKQSIPIKQWEYSYTDYAIITWYLSKYSCSTKDKKINGSY